MKTIELTLEQYQQIREIALNNRGKFRYVKSKYNTIGLYASIEYENPATSAIIISDTDIKYRETEPQLEVSLTCIDMDVIKDFIETEPSNEGNNDWVKANDELIHCIEVITW